MVDNYSTDKTVEIAKSYGVRVIQVRSERAKAKNIGLKHASGKYVLFIDSDMVLTPRVIEECVELAESNPRIAAIIIPEKSVGSNYWARIRSFERSFYSGTPVESPRFFRRDLALKAGGFDKDLIFYEEATLPHKLEGMGYNVRTRISSYIIHLEENLTLRQLIRKRYYYAKTLGKYLERYGYRSNVKAQIGPAHRLLLFLRSRRFYSNPALTASVLLVKTLEYIATTLGM